MFLSSLLNKIPARSASPEFLDAQAEPFSVDPFLLTVSLPAIRKIR